MTDISQSSMIVIGSLCTASHYVYADVEGSFIELKTEFKKKREKRRWKETKCDLRMHFLLVDLYHSSIW